VISFYRTFAERFIGAGYPRLFGIIAGFKARDGRQSEYPVFNIQSSLSRIALDF
jgi:hypothetical protein